MKKRLLFAFMALCVAVSGFALTEGEYIYTPSGRFQITSAPVATSLFTDFSGWEVITAAEGKTIQDIFAIDAEQGPAPGVNCAYSLDATAGEGMYFKFTPTSAGNSYVVSFKMKGAQTVTTRVKTTDTSINLAKIEGNSDGVWAGTNDVVVCNTAEETTDNWETYNYAIVGDGTSRTYFISFSGMANNIYIADLQIAEALQVADLRARDAAIERINVYKNVYAWPEDVLADYGINDALEALNAIGDQSAQVDLDDALATADETLNEFLDQKMDDYLATNPQNYLNKWPGKTQKASKIGDWTCLPGGRGFWENEAQGCWDLGHFQNAATWNNGSPTTAQGVTMRKELSAGAYVFAIKAAAAVREPVKNSWAHDDGMKPAYGIAYIAKVVDEAVTDTLVSATQDLEPNTRKPFYVTANITETATYEIGLLAYCKEAYQSLTLGSVTYVVDASLMCKNDNKYSQKQLGYEADVREQIKTGLDNLTTATESIANAEKYWGKAELQACIDTVAPKMAAYDAMSQDDIIATYESYYTKTTSDDNGLMVYEVYQAGVKDIIAANRRFTALNDTLESMQTAIDGAEQTLTMRLYDAATGKDALIAAINQDKGIQAQMKAAQYSEENAAAIETANAELADAVEIFKTTVPAASLVTLVDIDFVQDPVQNPETLLYSISGAAGTMDFDTYNGEGTPSSTSFEKGYWSNGELILSDVLRVGNGSGTVAFDPTSGTGSMGTNILKVDFDLYYGNLSGKSAGFYIYNGETEVAGLFISKYSGTQAINTFGLDTSIIPAVGSSTASNDAICVETNRTHFEIVFDFGEKSMYCSTSANGKSQTSEKFVFDEATLTSFVVKSDYNNSDRRSWFDNLKIQFIQAGATDPFDPTGIENAKVADVKEAPVKVFENGQVIIGGKYSAGGALVK